MNNILAIPQEMLGHAIGGYIIGAICIIVLVVIWFKLRKGNEDDKE